MLAVAIGWNMNKKRGVYNAVDDVARLATSQDGV